MNKARTPQQLHLYATTYEIVARFPDGREMRLGFTSRPSKVSLIHMARLHSDAILPHIGDSDRVRYSTKHGLALGTVTVCKSGRTERECAGA